MIISEGNTYELQIPLTVNGELIDINEISIVEFMFNDIRKYYGVINGITGDVAYEDDVFIVPFSQEETFSLNAAGQIEYQARVKFTDDEVKNTKIYKGYIFNSISKEVL